MSMWTRILEAVAAVVARGESLLALFERSPPERSVAFTIAVIALGAKMAKADGRVSEAEVAAFRQVFEIAREDEPAAARVFNLARQDVAGFEAYATQIARMFADQPSTLEDILEGLFHVALADGGYHPDEEQFLRTVAAIFCIEPARFAAIEARQGVGRQSDPWQVLGVPHDADLLTIRRRWRALVKEHHPDRLIARGLPPETVRLGNARIAAINRAWREIASLAADAPGRAPEREPA
jgi:DnaJ like chaperone protein